MKQLGKIEGRLEGGVLLGEVVSQLQEVRSVVLGMMEDVVIA